MTYGYPARQAPSFGEVHMKKFILIACAVLFLAAPLMAGETKTPAAAAPAAASAPVVAAPAEEAAAAAAPAEKAPKHDTKKENKKAQK